MKCGECNDIGYVILMNPEGERELEECACVHHPEMKMTDEELQKALQEGLHRAIDQAGGPRHAPFTPAQSRFLKVMIGEVMSKVVNKNQG